MPFPNVGGTEVATLRLVQGLSEAPFQHTVFCLAETPRQFFEAAGLTTVAYAGVSPSYRQPRAFLQASYELARAFRQRGIRLVHCADVLAAYFAAFAGRLAGLPVLCHVRNRHREVTRREQTFLAPVDRFVFVSQDARRHFPLRVAPSRGAVVYDGLASQPVAREAARARARREFGFSPSHKLVGMVARIAPQKDYHTLAQAAARVAQQRPEVRFLLIGDYRETPAHYTQVQGWLNEFGVAERFLFTGQRDDVPELLAALDVFVLCTHTEGFGLVLLEALAQGRPAIATALEGPLEILTHGHTGLLHEPRNAAQLAEQILLLLRDESYAEQLGQAGQTLVQTRFSQTQFLAAMTAQYQALWARPWRGWSRAAPGLAEQPLAEQPLTGQPLTGQPLTGQPLTGQALAAKGGRQQ
jgi:glycosyltransferase involved in cell wall biosynthesis